MSERVPMPTCPTCDQSEKVARHDDPLRNDPGLLCCSVVECGRCQTVWDQIWVRDLGSNPEWDCYDQQDITTPTGFIHRPGIGWDIVAGDKYKKDDHA